MYGSVGLISPNPIGPSVVLGNKQNGTGSSSFNMDQFIYICLFISYFYDFLNIYDILKFLIL